MVNLTCIFYFFYMNPFKTDPDGVPVFSTNDIDDYGVPELYGFETYRVVDSRDKDFVSDFDMEHQYDLRPIHRYDRIARFKTTLLCIIGERGRVPDHVIAMVKTYIKPDCDDPWNSCRRILKHYKQRLYYDRIPFILVALGYGKGFEISNGWQIEEIINKFKLLSDKFDRTKHLYKRRYFPNMRFIVLKLLESEGVSSQYDVPVTRTRRKNVSLTKLWNDLVYN